MTGKLTGFGVIGLTQSLARRWRDRTAVLAGIPLGSRPQPAEEIGHACACLASDLAASITGEALNVSGGQQMQ